MSTLPFTSASRLASLIRAKEIGSLELLDLYLQRMEKYNPQLNAIVVTAIDSARERARQADRAPVQGENRGALHGVPMTVKEAFDVSGMPTTWGIPAYKDNIAQHNALAVERLQAAGAIIFGKTNVPLALSDWQTFNDIYGTTNNPWDLQKVPGGSSGGSAAALAAGLTALEIGSDIGASIRNPAHYCGVYGHKPSYGIVSTSGHQLPHMVYPDSLDIAVIGPMARSAEDLAVTLDIIAGPDEIHSAGWQLHLPQPAKTRLSEYKVAIIYNDSEAEVDDSIQQQLQGLAEFLAQNRVAVYENKHPAIDSGEAHRTYIQLLRAATSPALSDAVFRQQQAAVQQLTPADDDYPAQMLRAHTMSHRDWLAWNETRHRLRLVWKDFFREYDLLLCPAAATPAFAHHQEGERWERMITVNGKPQPSTTQLFWAGYSGHVYLPSTVAPIGLSPEGLPIGVQIIGPQFGDYQCIHFARLLEREFYAFAAPPGYDQ